MDEEKKNIKEDEIDLRELFRVFIRRKWWFVGTFIIVLAAGLFFTFTRTPEYRSTSTLKISDDYYIESISQYFPEIASKLSIGTLGDVEVDLKSTAIREKVIKYLGSDISKNELDKAINISLDENKQIIAITTKHFDPEVSYNINKLMVDIYVDEKTTELTETYQELLERVEEKIINSQKEVEKLSIEAEQYLININLKIMEELEDKNSNVYFTGINYISPVLLRKLSSAYTISDDLEKISYILSENKNFFTSKIEVVTYPKTPADPAETNYGRNILVSLFLAIIMGFVVVFLANYFLSLKKRL